MHLIEKYYKEIVKVELINKFNYKTADELPKITKIVLNFGSDGIRLKKTLASSSLALELISRNKTKRNKLTKTKKSNIFLEIKKGQPIGCKAVLKKSEMYSFLFKLISEILPKIKNFKGLKINKLKKNNSNSFSFSITETTSFNEINENFHKFSSLPPLTVTLITNANTKLELTFLLRSLKVPIS